MFINWQYLNIKRRNEWFKKTKTKQSVTAMHRPHSFNPSDWRLQQEECCALWASLGYTVSLKRWTRVAVKTKESKNTMSSTQKTEAERLQVQDQSSDWCSRILSQNTKKSTIRMHAVNFLKKDKTISYTNNFVKWFQTQIPNC